jgi:hypothetical protein
MMKKVIPNAALLALTALGTLTFAQTAVAAGQGDGNIKRGCYTVKRATITESSVDAKTVVGNYSMQLASIGNAGPSYLLTGPIAGSEGGEEHSEEEGGESEGELHGGHSFGTDKHVGTFTSSGDSIKITSMSCPNGAGIPQYIKGIETMHFGKGTGIFTNLSSGEIKFNLTYDACNNRNNPVSTLEAVSGQLCFN